MQSKKNNRRPRARPRKRKTGKSTAQGIVTVRPAAFAQPLPRRLRTSFWCEADYKIPIATASLTSGAVLLNYLNLPFRVSGSSAFPSYTFLGPATETTLQPTGYTQLANAGLYNALKIRRSTIQLRWSGSTTGNNVVVTVVPALNITSIPDIYTARTLPFARQCTFSVSKPNTNVNRDGFFSYGIDPYTVYGTNPSEEKADLDVLVAGDASTPSLLYLWNIFVQTNDLDVTSTSAALFQVRLRWDVELYSLQDMAHT